MNTLARLAIAAVALIAVGCAAPGSPVVSASPSATPQHSQSPAASPSPQPSPAGSTGPRVLGAADIGKRLPPGTYRVEAPFEAPFAATVEEGWKMWALESALVSFGQESPDSGALTVVLVDNVYGDPCHTEGGPLDPPVAQTVDGYMAALSSMAGFEAGPISDARAGGLVGKTLTTRDADGKGTGCTDTAFLQLVTSKGKPVGTNPDIISELSVFDVGGTPVLTWGEMYASTTPADLAELRRTASSIDFD